MPLLQKSQLSSARLGYSCAESNCWGWLGTGHACACSFLTLYTSLC